ncbi:CRISPR-associated protein Csb2 [Plasticicumulans lactativorans]|uniref:CRISPR-associated protein Csb2 n=1 Tax=Plasticicumulans lactativorans TaxID=1133106 RepID=A0A4R2LJT6_9GAMM|nr:type I-U CRISPR-associated protein Csb2 [Plasticicumulans lactativorans]TCO79635.1 CRISPR-associated protein Csb2 [Plasticicumulans lactativorans]
MPLFLLSVRWLNDAPGSAVYHGNDWPPSPLRLFQALIAGVARTPARAPLWAALRHLETLPPPEIHAPRARTCAPVRSAVPNNDGDHIVEAAVGGETSKSRALVAKLKTLRERAGWAIDGPVHFLWIATAETVTHLAALQTLARGLVCLGQGPDLAWATCALLDERPALGGVQHTPDAQGANALPVPYLGALQALDAHYDAVRSAITRTSVRGVTEPRHSVCGYRSTLDAPDRPYAAFMLRTPRDEPWSLEGTDGMRLSAMVRHAIQRAAETAGLPAAAIRAAMGHAGAARLQVYPVPNVGHYQADGRLRRVLVVARGHLSPEWWRPIVQRLELAWLFALGVPEPVAMLVPAPADDRVLPAFLEPARAWTTATPVVLPGWDMRRGKARLGRTTQRLLRHAGIAPELVESVAFEPAAQLSACVRTGDYSVPQHLRDYPRAWLTLRFAQPQRGPFCLGAGEGLGLGLLRACER